MTVAPEAVAVRCADGGLCPPYSRGRRNCLSADAKCDEVDATAVLTTCESTKTDASAIDNAIVEQAPYSPKKGICSSLIPKDVPMHWLSKSPAIIRSISFGDKSAFAIARETASLCKALSLFSQVGQPSIVSLLYVLSNSFDNGPSLSALPTTEAKP